MVTVNLPKNSSKITFLKEGIRIFSRNIKVKFKGLETYSGNDEEICEKIVKSCYNTQKKCFWTSSGNYKVFYSRDFGWCIESLIKLGYKKEVNNTLRYALTIYKKYGGIFVAINCEDKPYNFPDIYSPDSVAYLFRSIRISENKELLKTYQTFLNQEIEKFESLVIDKDKGIIKEEIFSGMRDHALCKASCYDMIMACMLCDEIEKIDGFMGKGFLDNKLKKYDLKLNLIKHYWTGTYFRDGIENELCSGHSNVYPYFLDVITDNRMLKSSIRSIQKNRLDKPFPLKYGYDKSTKFMVLEFLARDWEKDTVWVMLGMAYIGTISRVNPREAADCIDIYKTLIEDNKGFVEVYDKNGKYYKSVFYTSDNSMLWASMYLDLKKKLKKK